MDFDDIKHNRRVVSNISNLLDDDILCDVIITIGDGEEIKAHKTILAAGSTYFKTMFTTPMIARDLVTRVNLQMFDKDAVKNIVQYLYNRHISSMNVIDVLKCADYLLIDDLVTDCESYIKDYTNHDTCICMYHKLYEMVHIPIVKYIKRMLMSNISTLITTDAFKKTVFEILFDIISTNDNVYLYREGYKVTILLKWLEYNYITEEQLLCILSCIDIQNLDKKSRLLLYSNKTINMYPSCIQFLLDNKQNRNIIPRQLCLVCHDTKYNVCNPCILVYNINTMEYSVISTIPNHIINYASVIVDNEIIIAGGYNFNNPSLNKVYKINIENKIHVELPPMIKNRCRFSLAVIDDTIYAIGGQNGTNVERTIECYTMGDDKWKMLPDMPIALSSYGMCVLDQYIYIIGGRTQHIDYTSVHTVNSIDMEEYTDTSNKVIRYDTVNNIWETLPNFWTGTIKPGVVSHKDDIYVVCDIKDEKNVKTCIFRYNTNTYNGWELVTTTESRLSALHTILHDNTIMMLHCYESYMLQDTFNVYTREWNHTCHQHSNSYIMHNILPIY
ncbi:CPXV215 protein [Cowpox virus]|uniref:CPXV215 protein n=1 Tax=Cowpox virus TaxID=10243 RepID=U5TMS9_COWPX|nr:CPXV215 protein [Cowpox virus]AGY99410.1 CPXV215 protein [Cowpox virus]AGZ00894.1 CPXV215 protein [Cowpox virus]